MDTARFDALSRHLGSRESRRGFLAGLSAVVYGGIQSLSDDAAAKKRKKKKKKPSPPSPTPPPQQTCTPNCDGRVCGDDGCGGSCGPCDGGTCSAAGQCVCPFGSPCSPGICCANGQACNAGTCGACPVGSTPCVTQICGKTAGGQPCACVTAATGTARYCVKADPSLLLSGCFACSSDAECDTRLSLPPGSAVCIGGAGCACNGVDNPEGRACMPKGC